MASAVPIPSFTGVATSATSLDSIMQTAEMLTHPLWVAVASVVVLIVYEWRQNSDDVVELGKRLGAAAAVIALGRLPSVAYILLTPISFRTAQTNPPWQVDVIGVVGVALTAVGLWAVWRYFDWGRILPGGVIVLLATVVPYLSIAVFWNISGHVTFDTALAVYLIAVDRRFVPVFLVPLVAMVNRPFVGAHTWVQSIAGLVLGLAVAGGIVTLLLDERIAAIRSTDASAKY